MNIAGSHELRWAASALFFFLAACNPNVDPITTGGGGSGGGAASGPQVWKGYVEAYQFEDGTDSVAITISGDPPTVAIVMGDHELYPPPTDPEVASPPVYRPQNSSQEGGVTGFQFTGIGPSATSSRITFTVDSSEQWAAWCALESPIDLGNGTFACLPATAESTGIPDHCSIGPQNAMTPIDCGKLWLCDHGVCECSATGCGRSLPPEGDIRFDLSVEGAHADGSVTGLQLGGAVYNVHLDRQ